MPAISQALGIHQSQGSRVGAGLNNLQVFGPGRGANPGHGATPVRGELGAADGLAAECHTPAPKALQDATPSPPAAAPAQHCKMQHLHLQQLHLHLQHQHRTSKMLSRI